MITINENRRSWELLHSIVEENGILYIAIDGAEDSFTLPTADGDYFLEDSIILKYNPVQSIKVKDGNIIIEAFYDDPYSREGFVNPFKKESSKISVIKTADNDIDKAKSTQIDKIKRCFDGEFIDGHFPSSTLKIEVDFRRTNTKNDLQNLESVISYMTRYEVAETIYRGYTESVSATLDELNLLKSEMEDYGLELYNRKWLKESNIDMAKTIEEVKSIEW